jgi:glycosyltransferase involved in cell wall biosynthesis
MKPKVSICIPTYNGGKYLRECLDSVLSQTFIDFEVLVVDDQSRDESPSIAHSYATKDPRIKVMQNKQNLGLVANWNRCVELAQGEWIKFVFQDDLIAPECLTKMTAAAQPGDEMVACKRTYVFEDASDEIAREYGEYETILSAGSIFSGAQRIRPRQFSEAALRHLGINFVGEPTAVMLHRSVFEKYGYFNRDFVHLCDMEFWMRVATNTGLVYVPETLATFRVHSSSESAVNRGPRHFRAEVLDPLLLIREYVHNSHYTTLRSVATELDPPVDLGSMLVRKSFWAYSTARSLGNKSLSDDTLREWKAFVEEFPEVEASLRYKWLRLRDVLERRLLWRFANADGQSRVAGDE